MLSTFFKFSTVIITLMIVGQSLVCDGKNKTRIKREEIVQQGAIENIFSIKSGNENSKL